MRFFNAVNPSGADEGGDSEERHNVRLLVATIGFALLLPLLFWGVRAVMNNIQSLRVAEEAAKQQVAPQKNTIRLTWVGEIASIEKGVIVVRDVLPAGGGEAKRVLITPDTLISKMTLVPAITDGRKSFRQEEAPLVFGALRSGWHVDVVSAEDISHASEFRAIQVKVLP